LNIAPEQSKQITIDLKNLKAKPGVEYFLTISAKTTIAENLLPDGWETASEQFKLPLEADKKQFDNSQAGKVTYKEGVSINIKGDDFSIAIDKKTGIMTSYKSKGKELLLEGYGPRPAFWRAPTDNDYGWQMPKICRLWKQASEKKLEAAHIKTSQPGNAVLVEVVYNFDSLRSTWKAHYTIRGNGTVKIENLLISTDSEIPLIPRIGMKMQIPAEFTQLEYFGRGPWENYCDRNSSAFVGRYKSSVAEQYVPYIRPQENGHRTDVRWMALIRDDGSGLLVVADSLIEFNVLNNPIEDFDAGPDKDKNLLHSNDIKPKSLVELHIDYRQMGVAGDDGWGAMPHEPYLIRPSVKGYRYGFTMVPISSLKEFKLLRKTEF